ncbi:hypothetical protein [Candidatus Trichorickettsia mobilis]|uniref:hypothetical protein n=1 Tax=Candidatus Trichorickettsia mobilis TaxID=1346319 RepID=UPI0029303B00|nr:hypothetical protein [Candidatus Trichorickettsia mobilis]
MILNGASYDHLPQIQQDKACSLLLKLIDSDSYTIDHLTQKEQITLSKEIIQFHNAINSDHLNLELVEVMLQQMDTQYCDYDISFYVILDKLAAKKNQQLQKLVFNNLELAAEREDYQLTKKILLSTEDKELTQTSYIITLNTAITEGNIILLRLIKALNPEGLINLLNGTNKIGKQQEESPSFLINAVINSDKSNKHLKFLKKFLIYRRYRCK